MEIKQLAYYYEELRKSESLKDIVDFPSLRYSYKESKRWEETINYVCENSKTLADDGNLDTYIERIKNVKILEEENNISKVNFEDDPDYKHTLSVLTIVLIKLYLLHDYPTIEVKSYEELDKFFGEMMVRNKGKQLFWRGQTHANFELVPSMYRSLNSNKWFKFDEVFNLYKQEGLISKYESVFENVRLPSSDNVLNMRFLAYMQHSVSFSPLLDATSELQIAAVFANYFYENTNFNDYRNSDSAIFCIEKDGILEDYDEKDSDSFVEDYSIQYINNFITPRTKIFGENLWKLRLEQMATHYYLYDAKSNDRMKYQHGVFLFPYHGIIVKNKFLTVKNREKITKIVIDKSVKQDIYKRIKKEDPQFDYDYLMNPYLYFGVK